jgi:hypothetical protein
MGKKTFTLADGSSQTQETVRIRSLKIGDRILHDVEASVAPAAGDLLLGQFLAPVPVLVDRQSGQRPGSQLTTVRSDRAHSDASDRSTSTPAVCCAHSGHCVTARRTGQIDPLLPFKICPENGREALESGLWLKA